MAPEHQPQLSGAPTQSVDCGVRSLSMVIDWATRGLKRPNVKSLRRRMGLPATAPKATNPLDWHRAVLSYDSAAELGGKYDRLWGTPITGGDWSTFERHLVDGKMLIVAVHYQALRKLAPRKVGSTSFSGLHAIPLKGLRDDGRTKSYDPLLDGRYPGCPDGPVLIPAVKIRQAALKAGETASGRPTIYGYLMERAIMIGGGVELPEPEEPDTLASVYADLWELHDSTEDVAVRAKVIEAIMGLESIIGPYGGQADPDEDAGDGLVV